jgi:hypothetical protein
VHKLQIDQERKVIMNGYTCSIDGLGSSSEDLREESEQKKPWEWVHLS